MRHVGDSRPPIQLPQGLGWKLLVSTPSLCQAYFFDAKCFFLHHWHKTYKLEHAITQTTVQGHSWEEDCCSCDKEKSLLCMEQEGPPSVIRGSFKLSWMQSTFSRPNLRTIHCNITDQFFATNSFVKYTFSALACTLFEITCFSIHCLFQQTMRPRTDLIGLQTVNAELCNLDNELNLSLSTSHNHTGGAEV